MRPFRLGAVVLAATLTPSAGVAQDKSRRFIDLEYASGGHERQKLDLHLPAAGKGWPVVVWVHGGAWRAGDKKNLKFPLTLLDRGYAVASVNYRYSTQATFPAQIEDCKAAIRWLRANADCYGYDAGKIGVWGASAGGHLVALLGAAGDAKEFDVGPSLDRSSRVQAVCDYFGPTDFSKMDAQGGKGHDDPKSPESTLLGGPVQERPDAVARANPIAHTVAAKPGGLPPFLIVHGLKDKTVPVGQSRLLLDALKAKGADAELVELPDDGHGGKGFETKETLDRVGAFFDEHLKAKPDKIGRVPQWGRWETALTARKSYADPYRSVEVTAEFAGPGGATFRTPGFWDGGDTFRVRAQFPAAGVWAWRTTCTDPADAGLHGVRGDVRVGAGDRANPLFAHGDLRVSRDERFLVHADGTPFLWLGDTAWVAAARAAPAEWAEYVEARRRQRFSVVQVHATKLDDDPDRTAARHVPFAADGTPSHAYWRALEDKVAAANDGGLVVLLVGVGNASKPPKIDERTTAPEFARYLAGRLAGHFVVFSPSMDARHDPANDEVGRALKRHTSHLVTQHPNTNFDANRAYHDADYTDFAGLQSGHHKGDPERAYGAARAWTLDLWNRPPVKPVINIEAMYDGYGRDDAPKWRPQDARKLGWITWLNGSMGCSYGAGDVGPKVPGGAGGVWKFSAKPGAFDHWRTCLTWPSAGQMTHLRDFFAGIEWWRLRPAPELVRTQPAAEERKIAASRSAAGDLAVVYLPDNPEVELDLTPLSGPSAATWFDPVTGKTAPLNASIKNEVVTLRRPSGWADAALLLQAPSPKK